jgi:hypothetical protein
LQFPAILLYKRIANRMLPIRPIDRDQVECEARAKTFWGDSREEVVKYLMMQGMSAAEATELTHGMFSERAQLIRGCGVRKIIIGIPLMAFPVVAWIFMVAAFHFMFIKIWAFTAVAGLYGMYCFIKGMIMFFSPGSEPGDVSEK